MKLTLNDEKRLMQGRWRVDEVPTGFCVTYTPNITTPPARLYSAKVLIARSHMRDDVLPVSGQPILVGQDFGRGPCSVIGQLDHKGAPLRGITRQGALGFLQEHSVRCRRPRDFVI